MPPIAPKRLISVDVKKGPLEQEKPLHNRWHPDIPHVCTAKEGELFRVETVDWTGGQIKDDDSAEDVKHVDLTQVSGSCNSKHGSLFCRNGIIYVDNRLDIAILEITNCIYIEIDNRLDITILESTTVVV